MYKIYVENTSINIIIVIAVERLIRKWAPIVWLAPEEKFMPLGVEEFLDHVHFEYKDRPLQMEDTLPMGEISETAYLVTNTDVGELYIYIHIQKFILI